ncbi:MAG: HDOD domain-containing protein [Pseudomonas sp.]|uniref:HDOD domain-containing protein n=1 Tax=Pseudomonas sp. TaxID=306 RepID=UPI0033914B6C
MAADAPLTTDALRFTLYNRFLKGEAKVPQMPENALRIRSLLDDPRTSVEQLSRVITSDPPLAAYLMQFADSPLLTSAKPCHNLRDVLARLGTQKLNNLVLGFSARNLFISKELPLQRVFRARWKTALERAAFSACLAARSALCSVDDALLAGLLQDIGSLPLLAELERWPNYSRAEDDLQALCDQLSGPIGAVVLTAWKQPSGMIDVARHRTDWQRTAAAASLADLVQVASLLRQDALPAEELAASPALLRLFPNLPAPLRFDQELRTQLLDEAAFWLKLLGVKSRGA